MAGLLGDIFSAGNVARRKLTDLLGNPLLSAQQIVGNLNDRARVLNEMTSAAAQEGVNYGPASRQLAGLLAEAYNPIGMTVYHGSPAKFTKFDPTKIGSGEGAQAYGYGHYVAESPAVAREYQKNLANPIKDQTDTAFITARTAFVKGDGDVKKAMKYLDQQQKVTEEASGFLVDKGQKSLSDIEQARGLLKSGAMQPGNMYEIDLPDEQIAKMLDWDKPLSQQPEILKALTPEAMGLKLREPVDGGFMAYVDSSGKPIGFQMKNTTPEKFRESWIKRLQEYGDAEGGAGRAIGFLGGTSSIEQSAISEALRKAGIPGIRYLDGGSRGAGTGTSNFVIFPGNEDLLTILKRNGGLLGP